MRMFGCRTSWMLCFAVLLASVHTHARLNGRPCLPGDGCFVPTPYTAGDTYDQVPAYHVQPTRDDPVLEAKIMYRYPVNTSDSVNVYLTVLANPTDGHFAVYPGAAAHRGGCAGRSKVSDTAHLHGCVYATNAGFFDMATGGCMGWVISDGQVLNRAASSMDGLAAFGLLKNGVFAIGYLPPSQVESMGFQQLVQGKGWLVRQGRNNLKEAAAHEHISEGFVHERAPRTVLGVDVKGRLVSVVVDGQEDIKTGATLVELTNILLSLGLYQAVNLDGGGSTVAIMQDRLLSFPTCRDNHEICERTVTTTVCFKRA